MKIFGFEIRRTRAIPDLLRPLSYAGSWIGGWWWPHETGTGTWQTNTAETDPPQNLLTFPAVFACIAGIAQDVSKLPILLKRFSDGIWEEITQSHGNSAESVTIQLLKKPNRYQTIVKFIEQWVVSKLLAGNVYVLKERDSNNRVVALYVLDPGRVTPLISTEGQVYYQLKTDYLSQVSEENDNLKAINRDPGSVTVPASEIIHDMMVSLWHPLVGVSPLTACALAATLGNKIANHSTLFFENKAMPGGLLTTPRHISAEAGAELKAIFEEAYSGANRGRIAVLGDDLKFTPLVMTAENAQLAEQVKMTREDIAMVFRYPLYKLGVAVPPYANGPQAAQLLYYTDCLQPHLEQMERCLDEGLELAADVGTEFDTEVLLRMDTKSMLEVIEIAARSGTLAPNENRKKMGYRPVAGGGSPMIQEQNFSLEALAKRDAKKDPFAKSDPPPNPEPAGSNPKGLVRERAISDLTRMLAA